MSANPPIRLEYLISPHPVGAEDRVRFEELYAALEAEYFRDRTTPPAAMERLEFNRSLQQAWRSGWAMVGTRYKQINLDAETRTNPAVVDAQLRQRGTEQRRWVPWAILGLIALFGFWYASSISSPPARHDRATPSPQAGGAASTTPADAAPTAIPGLISVGQQTPTALSPDNLQIGDRSFVVYNAGVDRNRNWIVSPDPRYASWLVGSVINWTFALMLQDDPNATAFLAEVQQPGTQAILNLHSAAGIITTRRFQFIEVRTIGRTDTAVYDIRRLGLTILIRTDDSDQRLYLFGRELFDTTTPTLLPEEVIPAATPSAQRTVLIEQRTATPTLDQP